MGIASRHPRTAPSHPAERAVAKLRAASAQLDELNARWDAFRAGVEIRFEPEYDASRHSVAYFAHVSPVPPLDGYAPLLRAAVADARSALDNMVYDLGVLHGVLARDLKNNAFPVVGPSEANAWAGRAARALAGLPADVVGRVRDVQPFVALPQVGTLHPLVLINRLSNDDKHRWGIELGLVPHVAGTHKLLTADVQLPAAVGKALMERELTPDEVDSMIDFDPNPVVGYRPVVALHLPAEVDISGLTLGPLDLPLSLAIVSLTDEANQPVFSVLRNAFRWARETVRYVTGGTDSVPAAIEPGLVIGPGE